MGRGEPGAAEPAGTGLVGRSVLGGTALVYAVLIVGGLVVLGHRAVPALGLEDTCGMHSGPDDSGSGRMVDPATGPLGFVTGYDCEFSTPDGPVTVHYASDLWRLQAGWTVLVLGTVLAIALAAFGVHRARRVNTPPGHTHATPI